MAKKGTRTGPRSERTARKSSTNRRPYSLSNLHPPKGSRIKKVRVGRGMGSKLGKTAGSGNKGQKSRRGYSRRRGFEGGQMPLHRRIPKRGFHNPFELNYSVVNLEELNVFPAGETVTPELLRAHGLIRRGYSRRRGFEGGQMPLHRRIPKRGFHNPFELNYSVVNLEELNVFPAGETV